MKTPVEYIEEKTDIEWIAREEWWDIIELAKEMERYQKKALQVEILSLLQAELDGNKTEENNLWHKINKLKQNL